MTGERGEVGDEVVLSFQREEWPLRPGRGGGGLLMPTSGPPVLLAEEDPFRIAAAFDLFVLERPLWVYTREEGLPPPPTPQAPVVAVAEVLGR